MLRQDQIRHYRENGDLVDGGVFGAAELAALGRVAERLVDAALEGVT